MINRRGVPRAAAPRRTAEPMRVLTGSAGVPSDDGDAARERRPRIHPARVLNTIAAATSIVVILVTGYGWSRYRDLSDGLHRSTPLSGLAAPAPTTSQNILLMGLDSRLDENGDPLPPALYQAMDTGGPDVGGHNANVLMLLHIPADGSRATVISIPRDDYVDLAGSPDGTTKGKIKQAYGLAFDQRHRELLAEGAIDPTQLEQQSRDAGRDVEITTVSRFLGVPIDHFVEVTMVAFYQIAQVVEPITVCLAEDTRDSYSGADFHQGYQQIDAAQALAFVRQRRDYTHPRLNFTDLDRERRQQAFIASLAYQLKQTSTLTDPTTLAGLLQVAKQNTAVDPGLDLLDLVRRAVGLASGDVSFVTLPIDRFGTDPRGEDVNVVDVAAVQAMVRGLFATGSPSTADATPGPTRPTVDLINASGRTNLVIAVGQTLLADGYPTGAAGTAARRTGSTIEFAPGDQPAAAALGRTIGIAATRADPTLPTGHLRVVLGTGYQQPHPAQETGLSTPNPTPNDGTSTPGDAITGGRIPCVK